MKNDAQKSRPRSRSRKKADAPAVAAPLPFTPTPENSEDAAAQESPKNVGPLESILSLVLGVLFVVGALFPRSFKQLLLLGLGGGLVYRGMTKHCGLYQSIGFDTDKGSLWRQVSEKYLGGPADKGVDI